MSAAVGPDRDRPGGGEEGRLKLGSGLADPIDYGWPELHDPLEVHRRLLHHRGGRSSRPCVGGGGRRVRLGGRSGVGRRGIRRVFPLGLGPASSRRLRRRVHRRIAVLVATRLGRLGPGQRLLQPLDPLEQRLLRRVQLGARGPKQGQLERHPRLIPLLDRRQRRGDHVDGSHEREVRQLGGLRPEPLGVGGGDAERVGDLANRSDHQQLAKVREDVAAELRDVAARSARAARSPRAPRARPRRRSRPPRPGSAPPRRRRAPRARRRSRPASR